MSAAVLLLLIFSHLPLSLSTGDEIPLIDFKEALKNSSALDSTWKKGTNPCTDKWKGVECDDNDNKSVSGLILMNLGLSGESEDIDVQSLSKLEKLRFLSLENNSFTGSIPEFNRLTSLRSLFLSGNGFYGDIPQNYFDHMGSLKKLELARNKFSGAIPDSIAKLDNLMLLLLDKNEFSGPVPFIAQKSLEKINFSYNKLQGEIPESMSKFGADSFQGNADLCGKLLARPCSSTNTRNAPLAGDKMAASHQSGSTRWVILGVVVGVLLLMILCSKTKTKEENCRVLGKESVSNTIHLHVASSSRRGGRSASRKGGSFTCRSSKRVTPIDEHMGDLVMINDERGRFGLQDLMKASAEVIGSGGLGSAYKAVMANGVAVVVKRLKGMNKLGKNAFESEVMRVGKLRHCNILPPLAYHYQKEEKLFVSEFVPKGSLLFLLHGDRGLPHADLTWPVRLKIIKGIARGMEFLHTEFSNYELPHGNLKSSNILLSSNYEPLLTDYALYPLISNSRSLHALFAYKSPEAVLYQQVSPKSDVYSLGVVILEIMTGKFPTQYLNNQKGGTDVVQWVRQAVSENRVPDLIDREIANKSDSLDQMVTMLNIGAKCTENDYDKRIEMMEAVRCIEEV